MKVKILVFLLLICLDIKAQDIKIPQLVSLDHPRFLSSSSTKTSIQKTIVEQAWAKNIYDLSKKNIDQYVDRHQTDSTWIVSRLQLYWKTRSTDVFIRGGVYDHAEGQAPVPTVRFPGTRDAVSVYAAPKLEDIPPYMDDPRGLYLINRSKEGQPMEWAEISKTGRIVESINTNIMGMAYTSAVLYWLSNETKYAKFAFDLFDTYMTGMQYRKEPFDLTHGHHQTLGGLSTFEVIQETAMLNSLTGIYDYLYDYLKSNAPAKMDVYTGVFKKWADLQIEHGVAFNNWNLIEAKNTLNIALILDDDKMYNDRKGYQYYTDIILNKNSERQWALKRIVSQGYDSVTGMWYECPGYSNGVLNDFIGYVTFFDKYYNLDIVEKMPVLKKAVLGIAQYLFPNGYHASFGDSHYGRLSLNAAYQMVANAKKNNKHDQERVFTRYIKTLQQFYVERGFNDPERSDDVRGRSINNLLYNERNVDLNDSIAFGTIGEFVTPVLSSPNVSYFGLRNGFDKKNGMMIAMSGSKGNHMHAGGMSMEIYGKGYVLGPESGIGTSYFQPDYAEYYSQFPAHNTVAVDGVSAYPVMKSNHAFNVLSSYPVSGFANDYFTPVSFGNLYFLEPETNADQNRLVSIIRTSDSTAYYVDIFRSKRKDGKDKMHDYFYHNMGQSLTLTDNLGKPFDLKTTQELSFGGGHLFAYDYIWDKKSIETDKDINAVFKLSVTGQPDVLMNLWMKGEKNREIFAAKSPKSTAIDRIGLPSQIAEMPLPVFIARQNGEALTKPFTVVLEPSSSAQAKSIASIQTFSPSGAAKDFEGLIVEGKAGDKQIIFSSGELKGIVYQQKTFNGTFGVISESKEQLLYLFLGNGKWVSSNGYSIKSKFGNIAAALQNIQGKWFVTCSGPAAYTIPASLFSGKRNYNLSVDGKFYTGRKIVSGNASVIAFELPALSFAVLEF